MLATTGCWLHSTNSAAINNSQTASSNTLRGARLHCQHTQEDMFYRCVTFKRKKIRMLLLGLPLILDFYGSLGANVIQIEHSKCTHNTVLLLIKESINHSSWPFSPDKVSYQWVTTCCLRANFNYLLKSIPRQVLLVNNMLHDSMLHTVLIALWTPSSNSVWRMVNNWTCIRCL